MGIAWRRVLAQRLGGVRAPGTSDTVPTGRTRRAFAGLLAWVLVSATPAVAHAGSFPPVPVTVSAPDGVARSKWPLSFGFPLPRGATREPLAIGIRGPGGAALPVQARVLARWDDGSVRWELLDTQVTLAAHQRLSLRVLPGKSGVVARPIRLSEGGDRFDIDTHAVRFDTSKTGRAIIDALGPAGQSATGALWMSMVAKGNRSVARPPRIVRVVEPGPLRTRIEMEGSYGNGFDYLVRIDAYDEQPFVRVLHTFINRNPAAYVSIGEMSLDLPLAGAGGTAYAIGVDGKAASAGALDRREVRATQLDNMIYQVEGVVTPGRMAGWVSVNGDVATVGLAAPWLWQEYPQGFTLRGDRVTYQLWDSAAPPAKAGMGAAKTHELVVWAGVKEALARRRTATIARPLLAVVDPKWIARTRALPQAIAPGRQTSRFLDTVEKAFVRYRDRNDTELWDDCQRVTCAQGGGAERTPTAHPAEQPEAGAQRADPTPGPEDRPRKGAYGMWNWGDWNFPGYHDDIKGCDAWGNEEYDTPQVLALGFAATGEPAMYEYMVAAARHFMDVDRIYFNQEHPDWVGMNHPKNPLHFTFELGGVDLGHTWTEGLLSYFYLTGDSRGLEAARGIADYLLGRLGSHALRGNPRQWGWPQIALLAVFDATGDGRYRTGALEYARRGLRAVPPEGDHDWKVGILADALAYTHAVTKDKEIEAWLRAYAKNVAAAPPHDARFYPGVAYVARLSHDPKLRALALDRAAQLDLGSWGKPFTINGRIGFRIYSLLNEEPATSGRRGAR